MTRTYPGSLGNEVKNATAHKKTGRMYALKLNRARNDPTGAAALLVPKEAGDYLERDFL